MTWRKDLKSQPTTGRYFPIRFGDAVRLVNDRGLVDCLGKRIKIRMENTEQESKYGYPISDIIPEEDLAIYSLPNNLRTESCQKLAIEAVFKLAEIQKRKNNEGDTKFSYFCAYIEQRDGLKVRFTRKDVSLQKEKYRGDSKFSNAFNPKKKQIHEIEL